MKAFLLFHLCLLCAVLASCKRAPEFGKTPIHSPGWFECFGAQTLVAISALEDGRLNYTVSRKQTRVGPSSPPLRSDRPWVIYPETPDRVWVYDGGDDVTLLEFFGSSGSKFTSSQVVPDLLKDAPPPLLERLPSDLRASPQEHPQVQASAH